MNKKKKNPRNAGRKVMDGKENEKIAKLEAAFGIGASDLEACVYAEIDEATLYRYQKRHPEFSKRKKYLRMQPTLVARQGLMQDLKTLPETRRWFLTKKVAEEFGDKARIDVSIIDLGAEAKKRAEKYLNK